MQNSLGILADSYCSSADDESSDGEQGNDGQLINCANKGQHDQENKKDQARRLLPVPEEVKSMTGFNDVTDDNPSLHKNRIRNFAHVRGNWATYVYIPFEFDETIRKFAMMLSEKLNSSFEESTFYMVDDFHVSVSRTVVVQYHWIESFVESLKNAIQHHHVFKLTLNDLEVYTNDDKTRTFVGWKFCSGYENLRSVVQTVDNCFSEFRLRPFYKDPSFHVSLVWCVGDQPEVSRYLLKLQNDSEELNTNLRQETVTELNCKIGNKIFQLPLNYF